MIGINNVLILGLIAGLMTGLGALIAVLIKKIEKPLLSLVLGFAAGIMIGISSLSLIPNSLSNGLFYSVFGFVLGGAVLWFLDVLLPHTHKGDTEDDLYFKMGIFIALGIALHNIPEGLAIGSSNYISEELGFYTALGIGLHNTAEGLCIAFPLALGNTPKVKIVLICILTGLSTLLGTFLGILIGSISLIFVSISLAFAAGAMIYIASDELIPQSHNTHSEYANVGIILGFVVALLLP